MPTPMVLKAVLAVMLAQLPNPQADLNDAVQHLLSQQSPNGLIRSYTLEAQNSWTFDQALALIALCDAGLEDPSAAAAANRLAAALVALQVRVDVIPQGGGAPNVGYHGYWYERYAWSSGEALAPMKVVTGPNAWVANALHFFSFLYDGPTAAAAELAAIRFARFALDELRPSGVDFAYTPNDLTIFSTEHNFDVYWMLRSLGNGVVHDGVGMGDIANELYSEVLVSPNRGYFDSGLGRWNRGSSADGLPENDCRSSDVQNWMVHASLRFGDLSKIESPLDYVLEPESGLVVVQTGVQTPFYGSQVLVGIEDSALGENETGDIWLEASAHILCALYACGRDVEAEEFLQSLLLAKWEENGRVGWPHSITSHNNGGCHAHFGREIYGIHAGATSWVYFALRSAQGYHLPCVNTEAPYLVFVDFAHAGVVRGNNQLPYNTLPQAVSEIHSGGIVRIRAGAGGGPIVISKTMRIEAIDGVARIGEN